MTLAKSDIINRLMGERALLTEALKETLRYAQSRAEDLDEIDPEHDEAKRAAAAVTNGYNLLRQITGKTYEGYPS